MLVGLLPLSAMVHGHILILLSQASARAAGVRGGDLNVLGHDTVGLAQHPAPHDDVGV